MEETTEREIARKKWEDQRKDDQMGEEEHLEEAEIQRTKEGMEISQICSCLFKRKFDEMK
jgi:hypothetical protein